jgi:hypothetical protein
VIPDDLKAIYAQSQLDTSIGQLNLVGELIERVGKAEQCLATQNAKLAAVTQWLKDNQQDVFRRGIWDVIVKAENSVKKQRRQTEHCCAQVTDCDCIWREPELGMPR